MIQRDTMLERSADIAAMVPYWDLSDTLVDGIDAMRAAGEKYLPKFPAESKSEYDFRLRCTTVMTNIFADIVETLANKPFEKETSLVGDDIPEALHEFAENVDGDGNNLSVFASSVFYGAVKSGADWIFVDHPPAPEGVTNMADYRASGVRPFWSRVLARNVLRATSRFINGRRLLTFVRILEPGKPDHIREMTRDDSGAVSWTLYVKTDKWDDERKTFFVVEQTGMLVGMDEIPLVPFFTGRRDGSTFKFDPPLKAAASLQEHLYQQESGLNYTTTLTAYPTLTGNGVKPERDEAGQIKPIPRGPSMVLYAPPNSDGTVGSWRYIEPSSNSLMFLQKYIESVVLNLRELGRQPLTASSSNLTTVTTAFAAGKSKSAVKAWAVALSDALENAMRLTAKWMDIDYEAEVSVYTEFDDFVDGKDYDALRAARDSGDISQETYWEECKRRGLFSPQFTAEREVERLLGETPGDGIDTPDNIEGDNPDDSTNV